MASLEKLFTRRNLLAVSVAGGGAYLGSKFLESRQVSSTKPSAPETTKSISEPTPLPTLTPQEIEIRTSLVLMRLLMDQSVDPEFWKLIATNPKSIATDNRPNLNIVLINYPENQQPLVRPNFKSVLSLSNDRNKFTKMALIFQPDEVGRIPRKMAPVVDPDDSSSTAELQQLVCKIFGNKIDSRRWEIKRSPDEPVEYLKGSGSDSDLRYDITLSAKRDINFSATPGNPVPIDQPN